ncbi:hypothetical protein ACIQ9Q_24960 [Streptomyces sp. NPDC094438]|uniref:hypothetical protein n=1 Tax=Streptomyces sp. NPDC094438 TaxID=3366061 RepID=UPI0037FD33BD
MPTPSPNAAAAPLIVPSTPHPRNKKAAKATQAKKWTLGVGSPPRQRPIWYSSSTRAARWEMDQRGRWPDGRDTRIGWNAKQVELLRLLDAQWAEQFRASIPVQCPGVHLEDVDAHPLTDGAAVEAAVAQDPFLARHLRKLRDKLREPH